jgi:hypothetical protein
VPVSQQLFLLSHGRIIAGLTSWSCHFRASRKADLSQVIFEPLPLPARTRLAASIPSPMGIGAPWEGETALAGPPDRLYATQDRLQDT